MTRQTSIAAYHAIIADGSIGRQQTGIYRKLYSDGPLTANECLLKIDADRISNGNAGVNYSGARNRFGELRDRGVVAECGTRTCTVTHRKVIVWDVTCNLPRELPKLAPKPKPEQLAAAAVQLRRLLTEARSRAIITDYDDVIELVAVGRWLANHEA